MKNTKQFKFYPMVESLEILLGTPTNPMELISLINKNEFLRLRSDIIDFFDADIDREFNGGFGSEVELGDVSDAVRMTTFSLYPQSTEPSKIIDLEERKHWCNTILDNLDKVANLY